MHNCKYDLDINNVKRMGCFPCSLVIEKNMHSVYAHVPNIDVQETLSGNVRFFASFFLKT